MVEPAGPHATAGPHERAADRGEQHEHADLAHAEPSLGPLDVRAWGAAALGIALGLLIAAALAISSGFRPT